MKKIILITIIAFSAFITNAQIPYFAGTQPKGNIYGYVSTNFKPGYNSAGTYTTLQYGVVDQWLTVGTDLSTSPGYAAQGFTLRTNPFSSKHFGVGIQTTSAFNLGDNYRWDYQSTGLFLNGNIAGNLGYCLNTWWTAGRGYNNVDQWNYIMYDYKKFHPMIGVTFDWTDIKPDLAVGMYYSFGKFNAYVWGGNLTNNAGHPKITLGIDFLINTK
jgi:hypothetical protein